MGKRNGLTRRAMALLISATMAWGGIPSYAFADGGTTGSEAPILDAAADLMSVDANPQFVSVEADDQGMVVAEESAVVEVKAKDVRTWEAASEEDTTQSVEPDGALGSLFVQDGDDTGPTLHTTNHDPDPSLANLMVQIKADSYGAPSDGDWSGWDSGEGMFVEAFDPTRRNQLTIIDVAGSCDEAPDKAKFRWGGLENGGEKFDIYELVQGPYQAGERYKDGFGNVIADYEMYYSEAFTRKDAGPDDDILAIYHFKVVYHLIVEPGERADLSSATVTLDHDEFVFYHPPYARPVPTVTLGGKVLSPDTDYAVAHYLNNFDAGTGTVVIKGKGGYSGTVSADFLIAKDQNSLTAVAARPSLSVTYDPSAAHVLASNVVAGGGIGGVTYRNATPPASGASRFEVDGATGEATIPRGTSAGTYAMQLEVTAAGDKNYERGSVSVSYDIVVDKAANTLAARAAKASVSVTYKPRAATVTEGNVEVSDAQGAVTYANASTDAAARGFAVDGATGRVTVPKATRAGTYALKVEAAAAGDANHEPGSRTVSYKVVVRKAKNPMAVKAVKRTAKASKLRKKAVTVAAPLKFTKKAQGKVAYARVAKGSAKCLAVNKKTGKVTVMKGTKKGTYKVRVKVTAKGNANYKAGSKTVTCKVVVK